MDTLTITTGHRFRLARERLGLSQTDVALRLAVRQSRISDFERGRRSLGLEILHRWCQACGIDPHEVDPRLCPAPAHV
jgi:transcriptional regulator with XRE-family HTH domain